MDKKYHYGYKGLQEILSCCRNTAYKAIKSGSVPYSKINRILVFDKEEVLKALKK